MVGLNTHWSWYFSQFLFSWYLFILKGGSSVVLGFRNFAYAFLGVGADVARWLCSHMKLKILARVDGRMRESVKCVRGARTQIGTGKNLDSCYLLCESGDQSKPGKDWTLYFDTMDSRMKFSLVLRSFHSIFLLQ